MSAKNQQINGNHYKFFRIQPVQFIVQNALGFLEGCIIKRLCRYQSKDGLEDLKKARHEIDLLIEEGYGQTDEHENSVLAIFDRGRPVESVNYLIDNYCDIEDMQLINNRIGHKLRQSLTSKSPEHSQHH